MSETGDVRQVIERASALLDAFASTPGHPFSTELIHSTSEQLTALTAQSSEVERLKAEIERARYAPLGDNHHNAAACPYCNPKLASHPAPSAHVDGCLCVVCWPHPCRSCGGYAAQNAVDALPPSTGWQPIAELRDLIAEVWASHRDPKDANYNECEKAECAWCEDTRKALDALPPAPEVKVKCEG